MFFKEWIVLAHLAKMLVVEICLQLMKNLIKNYERPVKMILPLKAYQI